MIPVFVKDSKSVKRYSRHHHTPDFQIMIGAIRCLRDGAVLTKLETFAWLEPKLLVGLAHGEFGALEGALALFE